MKSLICIVWVSLASAGGVDSGDTGDMSVLCFEDLDGDGYGSEVTERLAGFVCTEGYAPVTGDCDDQDADVNPSAAEVCDAVDNDCDAVIDEISSPDAIEVYQDDDGDGFGRTAARIRACGVPVGFAAEPGDCDDDEPRAYPGNVEVCDGIDNDCSGDVDEDSALDVVVFHPDVDGDSWGDCDVSLQQCAAPDDGLAWIKAGRPCDPNDENPDIHPGASGCVVSEGGRVGWTAMALFLVAVRRRRRRVA